jgi:hypothetical protein
MKRIFAAAIALSSMIGIAQARDVGYSMVIAEVLPFDRSIVLVDLEHRMWKVQTLCTGFAEGEVVHMVFAQPGSTFSDRIVDPDGKMPQCPVTSYMHIGTLPADMEEEKPQTGRPQSGRLIQQFERPVQRGF